MTGNYRLSPEASSTSDGALEQDQLRQIRELAEAIVASWQHTGRPNTQIGPTVVTRKWYRRRPRRFVGEPKPGWYARAFSYRVGSFVYSVHLAISSDGVVYWNGFGIMPYAGTYPSLFSQAFLCAHELEELLRSLDSSTRLAVLKDIYEHLMEVQQQKQIR